MRLVLADIEERPLHQVGQMLRARGAEVVAVPTNVAEHASVRRLAVVALDAFGAVNVVCNNAGVSTASRAPLWEASISDREWVLDVNVCRVIHDDATLQSHGTVFQSLFMPAAVGSG
jgi:NAD(P)-dependent dehydrogenase (short-subunit alcohol dehydrogenase family)